MEIETYDETMATRVALHPFLAGMNRGQLVLLADCAVSVRFRTGEVILRDGDHADRVYLIETGKVILESGKGHGKPVVVDTIRGEIYSVGPGCFRPMPGSSQPGRSNRLAPYFSPAPFSANTANAIPH